MKRYYKPEMGDGWHEHFTVDIIDGKPGNEVVACGADGAARASG